MKTYSVNETLAHMRRMPESLRYDEVLAIAAAAAPVAVGVSWGFAKIFAKWLHVKYLIPMFFTSTTAGLAIWYSVQTLSPQQAENHVTPGSSNSKKAGPAMVMLNRENPLNSESLRSDTVKKKKVIREERRIQYGDGTAPLPPLPELAPLPPGSSTSEITEEKKVVKRMNKPGKENKEEAEKADSDPFIDAMLERLEKAGLLKNREKFSLSLTTKQLVVDDKVASQKHRDEVIDLYNQIEKTRFGPGSSISINREKKQWSISKSIESD